MSFRDILKPLRSGERGFTLIELLIVTAILGILAGVAIPNVGSFLKTGNLNAANTELANVETASVAYYGNNNAWPHDSSLLTAELGGTPKATYIFDTATGFVIGVSDVSWQGITWSPPPGPPYTRHGQWVK